MYELRIERRFFAWHALRLYDGSFEPVHSHDWHVEVCLQAATLDAIGLAMDFHELERMVAATLDPLRDTDLNTHPALAGANPSAEHIARHLCAVLAPRLPAGTSLSSVTITESPGCRATCRA
jgi:6-pyruvoyltetrahydropterin/6-carboxytetrahydropterin synthase